MMSISKIGIAVTALSLCCLLSFAVAEAAPRGGAGRGQMLRDGSHVNSSTTAPAGTRLQQQQGSGRRPYAQPQPGPRVLGDGTQPRPQDGTGFGNGAWR